MTSFGALLVAITLAGPVASAKGSRLEQGQKLFNQGDLEGSLKQLDQAAQDERESSVLEKVHLLRGQVFAARQDFVRAEDAFALALDHNPDASLDPARVDPTVVKLLEAVRQRLTATLVVNSSPPGATLYLDTKNAGVAPQTLNAPIGKHKLEARWGEGALSPVDLTLKPKKEVRVEFVQGQAPPPVLVPVEPEKKNVKAYFDARGLIDIPPVVGGVPVGWFEFGGGIEFWYLRAGAHVRINRDFGVTLRAAAVIPVIEKLQVAIEAALPFLVRSGGVGWGLGATVGAEYLFLPQFGAFAQVGGQFLFANPNRGDNGTLTGVIGARLHLF